MAKFQELVGGYKMPSVGIGTFLSTDEEQLENALDVAFEAGYRHIDAAYIYRNEHVIGRVLKRWLSCGKIKREDLFITTKLPLIGNFPDKVEQYIKESLAALQLDYVDLYLIHFPVAHVTVEGSDRARTEAVDTDLIGIYKAMEEQVDAGRTKTIGISNFSVNQIERILKSARIHPVCLQVEVHPYLQQKELREFCRKNKIVVVGYGNLGMPAVNDFFKKAGVPTVKLPPVMDDDYTKKLAAKYKKTPAQVILRFLTQVNVVVIPKSVTPERIRQNIDIFDFSLTGEEVRAMEGLEKGEEARISQFRFNDKLINHPEFPFKK